MRIWVRNLFRHEKLPVRLLWWLAADGMRQWYNALRKGLAGELGGIRAAERTLSRIAAPVFFRHYEMLRKKYPQLPDPAQQPDAPVALLAGLMRLAINWSSSFMISTGEHSAWKSYFRGRSLLKHIPVRERWEEITTHLGEILIVLTERLPSEGLRHSNAVLGKLCFDMGVTYATRLKRIFSLPLTPASAIEVLRKGEYIFRVNPEHWSDSDPEKKIGFIEGTACPWYQEK